MNLVGQDHGHLLENVMADLGQQLVQAADHLLAVIGQVMPGVRCGTMLAVAPVRTLTCRKKAAQTAHPAICVIIQRPCGTD